MRPEAWEPKISRFLFFLHRPNIPCLSSHWEFFLWNVGGCCRNVQSWEPVKCTYGEAPESEKMRQPPPKFDEKIPTERKNEIFGWSAETRQHFTRKPPPTDTTTCTTTPPSVTTYVRAGALVPPPPCLGGGITRVGPGQCPQYTHVLTREAVGSSPHRDHRMTATRPSTSPTVFTGR